jgi:hypothetical protein
MERKRIFRKTGKGKGNVHPITGHEVPEGEWRYTSTLSLISALDWGLNGQRHVPADLPPGKGPGTHCIELYQICYRQPQLYNTI